MVHLLVNDESSNQCDSSNPGERRSDQTIVNSPLNNDRSSPSVVTGASVTNTSTSVIGPLRVSTDSGGIIYNNLERITPRCSQQKPKNVKSSCEKVTNKNEESHKLPQDTSPPPPPLPLPLPLPASSSSPCKSIQFNSSTETTDQNIVDQSMYHLYQNTSPRLMQQQQQQQHPSLQQLQQQQSNGGENNFYTGSYCADAAASASASVVGVVGGPSEPVPLSVSCPMSTTLEFLPLCDLLFNVISLAGYFCDIVFDLVTIYSLYTSNEDHEYQWFVPMLLLVICSSLISQYLSFKWYIRWRINEDGSVGVTGQRTQERGLHEDTNLPCAHQLACLGSSCVNGIKADQSSGEHEARCFLVILINNWIPTPSNVVILITHVLQAGVLWRYFRLFVPVNLHTVKYEVRDLCMLRMVHAFVESAPVLMIQVCVK